MNVEYDVLCVVEDRLRKVNSNLYESTEKMVLTLQQSQGFLAGNQFEKAKRTTLNCIETTSKTINNIRNAMEYIEKLKKILEEYSGCEYKGVE